MSRLMGNFIALNREKLDEEDFSGEEYKVRAEQIYIYLVRKARFFGTVKRFVDGVQYNIGPGMVIIEPELLMKRFFLKKTLFYKCAAHLFHRGLIANSSRTGKWVITVCNYEEIQGYANAPRSDRELENGHSSNSHLLSSNSNIRIALENKKSEKTPLESLEKMPPKKERKKELKKEKWKNKEGGLVASPREEEELETASLVSAPVLISPPKDKVPIGSLVWEAYKEAYEIKYGVPPVRNAQVNAICKQIVDRVGAEEAAHLVRFYLTHDNKFYLSKCHQLKFCLSDAEKLYTEMKKGIKMTRGTAEAVEAKQEDDAQYQRVMAMLEQKRRANDGK